MLSIIDEHIDIGPSRWYPVGMARKPRIHFAGVLYHVISRGNRRQVIFRDEGDYEGYRRFLGSWPGHRVKAIAEHFHRDPVGISQGMQKLEVRLRRTALSKEP